MIFFDISHNGSKYALLTGFVVVVECVHVESICECLSEKSCEYT